LNGCSVVETVHDELADFIERESFPAIHTLSQVSKHEMRP